MTLVEMHSAWERFAERRLVAALNHQPEHFLSDRQIRGVTRVPVGLADYVVKGGRDFFNFSNCEELNKKANQLVTKAHNPFQWIPVIHQKHLDVAAARRNHILHQSDASREKLGKALRNHFHFRRIPEAGTFREAVDRRRVTPERATRKTRLCQFMVVFARTIAKI